MWLFHYSHPSRYNVVSHCGSHGLWIPLQCSLSFLSSRLSEFFPSFSMVVASPFCFLGFHWACHPGALLKYCLDLEFSWSSPQRFPIFYRVVSAFHWGYKLSVISLNFQTDFLINKTGIFSVTHPCCVLSYFWAFVPAIPLLHEALSAGVKWNRSLSHSATYVINNTHLALIYYFAFISFVFVCTYSESI